MKIDIFSSKSIHLDMEMIVKYFVAFRPESSHVNGNIFEIQWTTNKEIRINVETND